jgi:hypothetical protein
MCCPRKKSSTILTSMIIRTAQISLQGNHCGVQCEMVGTTHKWLKLGEQRCRCLQCEPRRITIHILRQWRNLSSGVKTRDFFSPPGVVGGSTNSSATTLGFRHPTRNRSRGVGFCILLRVDPLHKWKVRIVVVGNEELKYPHSTAFQSHNPVAATDLKTKDLKKLHSHVFNTCAHQSGPDLQRPSTAPEAVEPDAQVVLSTQCAHETIPRSTKVYWRT